MATPIRVFVTTSDKYLWLLKPFAFLFNIFWSSLQPVVVAGYTPPDFELPSNFTFHSIDDHNYPVQQWSTGWRKFLEAMPDEYFVWMYEDLVLNRYADLEAINSLVEYAMCRPNILRIDLGTDRLYTHDPRYTPDYDTYGRLNIIRSFPDWPYHMSTQPAIWNKRLLLQVIQPDWTPWQAELEGGKYIRDNWLVLATRQIPLQYSHLIISSNPGVVNVEGIPSHLVEEMKSKEYLF